MPGTPLGRVVLISLERWDEVWRRNQHLASRLPLLGLADEVAFVEPATPSGAPWRAVAPGVRALAPRRIVLKRLGGLRLVGRSLRRLAASADTLWVNDPTVGVWLVPHRRAAYDVTDDWRCATATPRERRRLVAAEDRLAGAAATVVCSEELRRRWSDRYGVEAAVVHNAVDTGAIRHAPPRALAGPGPHVGYVGTLHDDRLDAGLALAVADAIGPGHLHLVGPDSLLPATRARLDAHPAVTRHGPVPAGDVPGWLSALDVLVCPHVVSDFTLSLDAIKAYEYLATSRPVVATPTSGFQDLATAGLTVTSTGFPAAVVAAAGTGGFARSVPDWDARAREMTAALTGPSGG